MTTPDQYLDAMVDKRVAVIGDSQLVFAARQLVEQGTLATGAVLFDFVGAVSGSGLRDLDALLERIDHLELGEFDAALVCLGQNDLGLEDANWQAFWNGTYPSPGGMPYADRVDALLDALAPLPVYWIGVPLGLPNPPWHPWEVAAVDIAIANAVGARYVNPDDAIGSYTPKFSDGLHYSSGAAALVFAAAVAKILAEL